MQMNDLEPSSSFIENSEQFRNTSKYLCGLNLSHYANEFKALSEPEPVDDPKAMMRRKWMGMIAHSLASSSMKTIVAFFFASKFAMSARRKRIEEAFQKWKLMKEVGMTPNRKKWIVYARSQRLKGYRQNARKTVEARAALAAEYLIGLPEYKTPIFDTMFKRMDYDEKPDEPVEVPKLPLKLDECEDHVIEFADNREEEDGEWIEEPVEEPTPVAPAAPAAPAEPKKPEVAEEEPLPEPEKLTLSTFLEKVDLVNVAVSLLITIIFFFVGYRMCKITYRNRGIFRLYNEYQFNLTMPEYDRTMEVKQPINFSEILRPEPAIPVEASVKYVLKQLRMLEGKQDEMSKQLNEMAKF